MYFCLHLTFVNVFTTKRPLFIFLFRCLLTFYFCFQAGEGSTNPQILDSLDPSFLNQLNNLQANQIDDLENALLPHLHTDQDQHNKSGDNTTLQFKKTTTKLVEDSFNTTVDEASISRHLALTKQEMLQVKRLISSEK